MMTWIAKRGLAKWAEKAAVFTAAVGAFIFAPARAESYEVIDAAAALQHHGATGGDEIRLIDNLDGTLDIVHIFTNVTTSSLNVPADAKILSGTGRFLVVGGGGGGGADCGGGGGAGRLIYLDNQQISAGTASVTVGAGGAEILKGNDKQGNNGSPSALTISGTTYTAIGGGGGGCYPNKGGLNGGSGGGGFNNKGIGMADTDAPGFGHDGGASNSTCGGGGGGAGSDGGSNSGGNGGAGGDGLQYDITGEERWYAAGGGGGGNGANNTGGIGGSGVGGAGGTGGQNASYNSGVAGTPGTGSGGGGACGGVNNGQLGAAGGSGIVVIRYTVPGNPVVSQGATVTEVDGEKIYTFTDTTSTGKLVLTRAAKVDVLVVGGGGAGGWVAAGLTAPGGGGGGAGGFLEKSGVTFNPGVYEISVGAGGIAASTAGAGADGQDSSIKINGNYVVSDGTTLRALKGGGGGSNSVGTGGSGTYGSGGGGSKNSGGEGTAGQGNKGGTASGANRGAGGGGAGGIGGDVTTGTVGGAGGNGKSSSISGTEVYYAGGGGGYGSGTGGAGGSENTGGMGGSQNAAAGSGKNATGSGGGGGRATIAPGNGGSGIVIVRVKYIMPEAPESLYEHLYDGENHVFYPTDEKDDGAAYTIKLNGSEVDSISARDVGTYTFTTTPKTGYCWADGSTGAKTTTVKITAPPLVIESITHTGWQLGETPAKPVIRANISLVEGTDFDFVYSTDASAPITSWTTTAPTSVGSYYVTAVVHDSTNYTKPAQSQIPVASFQVWEWVEDDKYLEELGYHAKLTVSGYTGETLTDFPMLVKISEGSPAGFRYKYTNGKFESGGIDALDLRFIDTATGNILPFEIDTWNPEGESILWVKVPTYANGKSVTMCWGELVDKAIPETPASSEVWTEYAGVWHMNEEITAETAGSVKSADSSGNGYDMSPHRYSTQGDLSVMVSTSGVIGSGRVNGEHRDGSNDYTWLLNSNFDNSSLGSSFTVSGWFSMTEVESTPRLFSTKATQTDTTDGWEVQFANNRTKVDVYGYGTSGASVQVSGVGLNRNGFVYVTVVYDGNKASVFAHGPKTGTYEATNLEIAAPTLTTSGLGIGGNLSAARSFWGIVDDVRVRKGAVTASWAAAEYAQAMDAGYHTWGPALMTPHACFKNRWIVNPTISKSEWLSGGEPAVVTLGEPAYGSPFYVATKTSGEAMTNEMPVAVGEYFVATIVEAGDDTSDGGTRAWGGLVYDLGTVLISAASPYSSLSGGESDPTTSGRILLVNDYVENGKADVTVADQSYWLTDPSESTYGNYWIHSEGSAVGFHPNVMPGTVNELVHTSAIEGLCGATTIWYLDNVRIGNTYSSTLEPDPGYNYLPQSPYAKAISSKGGATGALKESAHMLLCNSMGAAIYSPCYTNGIGTIYFDAVNSLVSADGAGYGLVLEVCKSVTVTNEDDSVSVLIPTDENVLEIIPEHLAEDDLTTIIPETTNRFGRADWEPVVLHPLVKDGTAGFVATNDTTELALAINRGGTAENFYRVYATFNTREPIRFRIRRTSVGSTATSFILVDNLIVSHPAMRVDLEPFGVYDSERSGKQTLGQELAFDVPFPSAGAPIVARAKPTYSIDPSVADYSVPDLVTSATMFYRWRYLDQVVNQWQAVGLGLVDGTFRATSPIVSSELPGDMEFWYLLKLNAPFYNYFDYSGADLGLGGLYTENISTVSNRANYVSVAESRGKDWFVRLREGVSDVESAILQIRGLQESGDGEPESEEPSYVSIPMELIDNHIWRGYFQTPTNIAGSTMEYRIAITNRQSVGDIELANNVVYWTNGAELNKTPISSVMSEEAPWTPIAVDAVTGYLLFQVDDESKALTIVHADYQNFNSWADAKGTLFVGTSTEDDKKSGSAASKREFRYNYACGTMSSTNKDWKVPSVSFTEFGNIGNRPAYKVFSSDTSDAWEVGQGMWVAKYYRDNTVNSGVGLQLAGQGLGYMQLTDRDFLPRGIESIKFNARLAQDIDFERFAYSLAENTMSLSNYTFYTTAAFDAAKNKGFRGNGTMSLVAYYRREAGCYEFRVEQVIANSINTSKNTASYNPKGQSLSLYKWTYNQDTGKLTSELKCCVTNSIHFNKGNWPECGGSSGYQPLFISVTNATDGTRIVAGFRNSKDGVSYSHGLSTINGVSYNMICFRDDSNTRLTSGSYGVLSANCNAEFVRFYRFVSPVSWTADSSIKNYVTQDNKFTDQNVSFGISPGQYVDCMEHVKNSLWYVPPGRMKKRKFQNNDSYWGLEAAAPAQGITLYTRTTAKGAWTPLKTISVTGFGKPDQATGYTHNLWEPETTMIRLSVDGELGDVKRDVVIDSFEVTQWAGADWISYKDVGQYVRESGSPWSDPVDGNGSYTAWGLTNFVFTSGWLDGRGVVLSAKRTPTNSVASIRSPLMDDYKYDLEGGIDRGIGLGMFSFSYESADDNVNLLLQVATNNVNEGTIGNVDRWDDSLWITVTNFNFSGATDKGKGMRTAYIGMHGVKGVMRIVMDPESLKSAASQDNPNYGSIRITEAFCRDEPNLDTRSWWGWNMRTVGADTANLDNERRMYLPDYVASAAGESGLSLALNNSIVRDIVAEDADAYKEHMPFVQTPTFETNVVGSVTFRARKYEPTSSAGFVAVYGSATGLEEDDTRWTFLTNIAVSSTTYQTFTYTTDPGQAYAAFRLGVSGVDGVTPVPGPSVAGGPMRVLIDEVLVSEAIRARMAFRNVGAFHTKMNDGEWVPNVPSRNEQPLCNEGWGVQCEVFAAQLKDEIDTDRTPEVYLWYYVSEDGEPWGFSNWKSRSRPRRMALAEGTNGFYRSSYRTAEDAVVGAVQTPGTIVQYMLEVRYWQKGHSNCVTNWMEASDWTNPAWYSPLDLNAGKSSFSAYSIIDTVPPGWAWINEVNLFGDYVDTYYYENTEKYSQFVEIAVPQSADISNWFVRMLCANQWADSITTNIVGTFGFTPDLGGTKAVQKYVASNMVFRVLGSPFSHKKNGGKLDPAEGEIDAAWTLRETDEQVFMSDGSLSEINPVAIQLVRPSGIIEHEIICVGTNYYGSFEGLEQYYHPTNVNAWLNAKLGPKSAITYVGDDDGGYPNDPSGQGRDASLGVMEHFGQEMSNWSNGALRTPGKINVGQEIDGVPPEPNGETVVVFANIDNTSGHLRQQIGDYPLTNIAQVVYLRKGGAGTNIVYEADLWYELESVKTNGVDITFTPIEGESRRYMASVGAGCSNNVTVVAKAKVFNDLSLVYGVDENDPYRPAIVDWLTGGTTLRGEFEGDEIRLAEFWPLHGTSGSPMTLREMYWLDMDPTVGNLVLRGGMSKAPGNRIVEGYYGTDSWTNISMGVTLYMTNKTDRVDDPHYGEAWTPYVLRGIQPGEHSMYYTESSMNWTSVTFMVQGVLANGYTSDAPGSKNWVPLRWFVFNENSFRKLDGSEGNPAESIIEVADPYSTSVISPATAAGWRDWLREHGWTPIFFNWSINTNITNWGVSPLKKDNPYEIE